MAIMDAVRQVSARAAELYHKMRAINGLSIDVTTPPDDVDAACELERYGFIFRQPGQAGYNLFPTPFEILIPSLLHRIDWSYPPFDTLPRAERERLRDRLCEFQDSDCHPPFAQPLAAAQALEGAAQIDAFVSRVLHDTLDVCAVSAAEWSGNLPLLWSALVQRLKDGMRYRRIVSPLGFAAFGWAINYRDTTETGVDLRVSSAQVTSPFYLFAGAEIRSALVFASPTPMKGWTRATYTAVGQLTKRLSELFDDLWDAAIPAQTILTRLQHYRTSYIKSASEVAGELGANIASLLFNKGIFAQLPGNHQPTLDALVNAGLVMQSNYSIGLTRLVPNLVKEIESYLRSDGGNDDRAAI